MGQEFAGRAIDDRPTRHIAAARRPDPARLHQHVERPLGGLHTADRFDFGAADRLVVGNDRQHLEPRTAQLARLIACPAQQVREIGRRLEMPAPAALDQLDALPGMARGNRAQRRDDIALADKRCNLCGGQRRFGSEHCRFDRAAKVVGRTVGQIAARAIAYRRHAAAPRR